MQDSVGKDHRSQRGMRWTQLLLILVLLSLHLWTVGGQGQAALKVGHHNPHAVELSGGRRHTHRAVVVSRSITDSHPLGANRSCSNQQAVRAWLPSKFRQEDHHKHMHLLLCVSDNQLAHLINFLAIAFTFRYLPNPRVLIHFTCHGHLSKIFVEKFLEAECQSKPRRIFQSNDTSWRHIIKDRLGTLLEIVNNLDETDSGAMAFDLDSVWIRNMVPVFDHLSQNYDFISQGTIQEGKFNGRVISNFGGVYFKNSIGGKTLAATAWDQLNSGYEPDMPDQDFLSKSLFEIGKATQKPLPEFSFARSSEYSNSHCSVYPDTCTHIASGVNGTFILGNTSSAYLFLPQIVAPHDCSHICSSSTLLFQHCGIAKCVMEGPIEIATPNPNPNSELPEADQLHEAVETNCSQIPEFIITSAVHHIHAMIKQHTPKVKKFKTAHSVFDSSRNSHMMGQIELFVDKKRAQEMCRVYHHVCTMSEDGFVMSED